MAGLLGKPQSAEVERLAAEVEVGPYQGHQWANHHQYQQLVEEAPNSDL